MIERQYMTTDIDGEPLTDAEREWLTEHRNELLPEEPFARNNWKTAASRDSHDQRAMAAVRDEAEWRSVLDDRTDRKAAIIHISHKTRSDWLRRIGEHGLHYRAIREVEPYDGFSHETRVVEDPQDPERITYSVIAQNADVADKMYEAETEMTGDDRHRTVAKLLGFPDCCIDYFMDVWIGEYVIDPLYEAACNTASAEAIDGDHETIRIPDPNPLCCPLWRYYALSFVTHLPCSFDCEKSIEIGRVRGEIAADNGLQDEANALYGWLSEPALWESVHGQVNIRNRHMIGASGSSQYWSKKTIVWDRYPDAQY